MRKLFKNIKLKLIVLFWIFKFNFSNSLFGRNFGRKAFIAMVGRLGNQFFIHAFAKRLQKELGISPIYDISAFGKYSHNIFALPKYNINIPTKGLNYDAFLPDKYKCYEKKYGWYDEECFKSPALLYKGYYQSEKFFKDFRQELLEEFRFKEPFDDEYSRWYKEIKNSNSVLLNFRVASDYTKLGWTLDFDYQREAMEYIVSKVEDPKFFVFADDIEYVKENFKCNYDLNFVDIGKENENKVYFDLELMKKCKHAIIPNSSFSWWAAWLNENPEKIVVAPKPWLFMESEIVPEDWVQINAKKVYCKNPLIV